MYIRIVSYKTGKVSIIERAIVCSVDGIKSFNEFINAVKKNRAIKSVKVYNDKPNV